MNVPTSPLYPIVSTTGNRPVWLGKDTGRWDHSRVHVQLLKDPRLGAYELSVYLGLTLHCNIKTGDGYPSTARLASYLNVSEKTVRRAVKKLADIGYLSIKREKGKPNIYRLLPPPTLDSQTTLQADPGTSVHTPWTHSPMTLVPDADELEPLTRSNNETDQISNSLEDPYEQIKKLREVFRKV